MANPSLHRLSHFELSPASRSTYKVKGSSAEGEEMWLGPLSTLNVFIGPNNSGKSRFLRELFASGPETGNLSMAGPWSDAVRVLLNTHAAKLIQAASGMTFEKPPPGHGPENFYEPWQRLSVALSGTRAAGQQLRGNPSRLREDLDTMMRHVPDQRTDVILGASLQMSAALKSIADSIDRLSQRDADIHGRALRVYVPILRGLRPLQSNTDVYEDRTLQDYFEPIRAKRHNLSGQGPPPVEIVTGLSLYNSIRSSLLGTYEQRESIAAFQEFLRHRFFRGERVTITPTEKQDVLHVKIGDEREQPIFHLGDGLQHLIVLTAPMFLNREKHLLLFLEEPENCLHPGFQRMLVDAILDEPCSGSRQVFVATHSHQFLDITLDKDRVSVFAFRKQLPQEPGRSRVPNFTITPASNDSFPILHELGIRNSSVLLSNCTIWVEGVTDRAYFRHFLKLYQSALDGSGRQFDEDIHYSFVEYGGVNVVHWSFLDEESGTDATRVCGELMLIADRDDESKDSRHEALAKSLKDKFVRLPVREIENLLPPETIRRVIGEYEGSGCTLQDFKQSDYRDCYLGSFIQSSVLPKGYVSKRRVSTSQAYAEKSGTVRAKAAFAKKAIEATANWSDLSSDAQAVTKLIYDFISSRNPAIG